MTVDEIINKKPTQAYERNLWHKLNKKWTICDRISITAQECEMLLDSKFTNEQVNDAKKALFSANKEERMFNDNIIFILENEHKHPKNYIFLMNNNAEFCDLIVFDSKKNLLLNGFINRKTHQFEANQEFPTGFKVTKEQVDYMIVIHQFIEENLIDKINFILKKMLNKYFSIILSLACYVENVKILKEVEVKQSNIITSSHTLNKPYVQSSRRLTQVVYQYQQERRERHNKTYNRYTDSWEVRGHFRTLKSGKRIWVRSYEKGHKDNNKEKLGNDYKL